MKLKANWIWCSGEASPRNFYLYCRKSFELSQIPKSCPVQVTADSRYILYINGHFAGRGPVRCDPRNQFVDTWDIAPYLKKGRNVIAALVHHYGEGTFAYIHKRGGFLLAGSIRTKGGTVKLGTDATWRVCPSRAWRTGMSRMSIQIGYPEDHDAQLAPQGWNLPDYDDSAWEKATVVAPAGQGPWAPLVPRDIPPLMETIVRADSILETSHASDGGHLRRVHLGHFMKIGGKCIAYVRTSIHSPIKQKSILTFGSPDSLAVWFRGQAVFNQLGSRTAAPDLDRITVELEPGWNRVLVKLYGNGHELPFYLRVMASRESVRLAAYEDRPGPEFAVLGPLSVKDTAAFAASFPAESEEDLTSTYKIPGGNVLSWTPCEESFSWHHNVSVQMEHSIHTSLKAGAIIQPASLLAEKGFATIKTSGDAGVSVLIDFGREVVGFPRFALKGAHGGEVIDLGYSELLVDGRAVPNRSDVHYADRYVARPGDQVYETFDKRAFRYLQLDVHHAPEGLRIGNLCLNFTTYNVGHRGCFECSDDRLNQIWKIGAYTVQLNMEDAYTDCPWRERGQWWGDARIEALCNYYAFGDTALMRRGIRQMSISQDEEGMLQGCYPTEFKLLLPDFVLVWILTIHDYYHQTGDLSLFREMLPVVRKALAFFKRHTGKHGLLYRVPHWNFIDWAAMGLWGESAPMNGYHILALDAVAEMAGLIGERQLAGDCLKRAAASRKALIDQLYDVKRRLLRDCRDGEKLSVNFSQAGNSLAVLGDVFNSDTARHAVNAMLENQPDVFQIGTPYFAYYLLAAMYRCGQTDRALAYMREKWGAMMDAGATTWWEHWHSQNSLCHGWASAPTYYLPKEVLGVKRAAPGWERVRIEPAPGDLEFARGVVPAPPGDITADWKRDRKGFLTYNLDLPAGITADVLLPGEPRSASAGLKIKQFEEGGKGWTVKGSGKFRFMAKV